MVTISSIFVAFLENMNFMKMEYLLDLPDNSKDLDFGIGKQLNETIAN